MAARPVRAVLVLALALVAVVYCFFGHRLHPDAFVSPPAQKKANSIPKSIEQDPYTAALVMGATGFLANPAPALAQARGENDDAENNLFFLYLWPAIAITAFFRAAADYLGWGRQEAPSAFGIAVEAPDE